MKHVFTLVALVLMSSALAQLPDYVPINGLVAWWGLNGDGADASDLENHGTVYGAVGSEDRWGVANSSMSFENYGDRIEFGEISTSIGLPNQALTISSWFKGAAIQNGSNSGQIVAVNYGTTSRQVRLEVVHDFAEAPEAPGNRLKYYWRCPEENDEPESPEEYSPLMWNHYVLTVDPEFGEVRIYLNGIQVNEMTSTYAPTNDYSGGLSRSWMIGALYPSPNFESPQFYGNIDDVGIWNKVLTESEILALYNAEQEFLGCTDPLGCNFNDAATGDDGSCDYNCCPGPGCCDVGMHWDWELGMCQITNVADTNLDGCVQLNDLLDVLSAYGNCTEAEVVEHPCSGGAFFPGDDLACAGWNYLGAYDGGEYYVSTFPLAWDSAQAFAAELNGGLAVISSQEENDWISDLAGDNYVWFGLYQDMSSPDYSEPGGGWLWVDDSPFVYENWATNEPNNVNNGTEHHCQMYSNGLWNDAPGDLFINSSDGRDIYAVIEFR